MGDAELNAANPGTSRAAAPPRATLRQGRLRPGWGLLAATYLMGITWLSSIPRDPSPGGAVVEYGLNLAHIPLFAGLTWLLIQTVGVGSRRGIPGWVYSVAALGLALFALADEWHQSFVPGRSASLIDVVLDMMGAGAVLLFYRLSALASEET